MFREIPLIVWAFFFYSSTLRGFLFAGFFRDELSRRRGAGGSLGFLYVKCYIFARINPWQKVLFLLAWRFYSSPFLRDADLQGFVGRTSGGILGRFFGARLSCWGIMIWPSFRHRTPQGFFAGVVFSFRAPVFFSLFSLSLLFSSFLVLAAGLGASSCSSCRVSGRTATDSRYTDRREQQHAWGHIFLFLSPRVGRLTLSSPSFYPLFFSSLRCLLHASRSDRLGPLWKAHRDGNRSLPLLLHWSLVSTRNS